MSIVFIRYNQYNRYISIIGINGNLSNPYFQVDQHWMGNILEEIPLLLWAYAEREETYVEGNSRRKKYDDGKMTWNIYWGKYMREDKYSEGEYFDWK